MTYAAFITIAAQFIFVINLFWSMFKGPKASDNPWEATTLEWTTATPPPHDNFGGVTPVVNHGPYEYGVPGRAKGLCDADGSGERERRSIGPCEQFVGADNCERDRVTLFGNSSAFRQPDGEQWRTK